MDNPKRSILTMPAFIRPNVTIGKQRNVLANDTICKGQPHRFNCATVTAFRMSVASPETTSAPATLFPTSSYGEWFGVECFFSAISGDAENIHERYVPDAYRDWGVEISHFETVASTNANRLRHIRALPSVGCEADAVATEDSLTEDVLEVWKDGSFVSSRTICVAHPNDEVRERVRVECASTSRTLSVTVERWESVYCDGAVLPGCGGALESFSHEKRIDANTLAGRWKLHNGDVVTRDEVSPCIMLPRGITVDAICIEGVGWRLRQVAWLPLDSDVRNVVRCVHDRAGDFVSADRSFEQRVVE